LAENSSEPLRISETVSGMITQLVAGDRQVFGESLATCSRTGVLPTLWIGRRLAGKLCFVWLRSSRKFRFFNLLRAAERTQVAADVRVSFALEPVRDQRPGEVTDLPTEYVPPRFVVQPAEPRSLQLQLPEAHTLELRFSRTDQELRLEEAWPDGQVPAEKPKENPILALIENQPEFLRLLVNMFAVWRQTGDDPPGPGYPLDLGANLPSAGGADSPLPFQAFVREVQSQVIEVLRECQTEPALGATGAGNAAGWGSIHPLLGGGYTLTQLQARALLQLNANGELFRDPQATGGDKDKKAAKKEPEWHQVDVVIRVLLEASPCRVQIGYLVPDILTKGDEYHDRFTRTLDQGDEQRVGDLLWKIAEATVPLGERVVQNRVRDRKLLLRATLTASGGWANAVFLRIAAAEPLAEPEGGTQGAGRDTDLVFLPVEMDGARCYLTFFMEFLVTAYPEVEVVKVEADRIRFLGKLTAGAWTKAGWHESEKAREEIAHYFHRQFTTLYQWQELQRPA
jgi:hypothetical protein